jgi:hypothetical protein
MAAAFGVMALEETRAAAGASPSMMARVRRAAPALAFAVLIPPGLRAEVHARTRLGGPGGLHPSFPEPGPAPTGG